MSAFKSAKESAKELKNNRFAEWERHDFHLFCAITEVFILLAQAQILSCHC